MINEGFKDVSKSWNFKPLRSIARWLIVGKGADPKGPILRLVLVPESLHDQNPQDQNGDAEIAAHQPQGRARFPQTDKPNMFPSGALEDLLTCRKFEEKKVPESVAR